MSSGPRSTPSSRKQSSLGLLSTCRRLSLDRARCYNLYPQLAKPSTELSTSLSSWCEQERQHRESISRLRRSLLTPGTSDPERQRPLLEAVATSVLESATLTSTWTRWLRSVPSEQLSMTSPGWTRLSTWCESYTEASTAFARTIIEFWAPSPSKVG